VGGGLGGWPTGFHHDHSIRPALMATSDRGRSDGAVEIIASLRCALCSKKIVIAEEAAPAVADRHIAQLALAEDDGNAESPSFGDDVSSRARAPIVG